MGKQGLTRDKAEKRTIVQIQSTITLNVGEKSSRSSENLSSLYLHYLSDLGMFDLFHCSQIVKLILLFIINAVLCSGNYNK